MKKSLLLFCLCIFILGSCKKKEENKNAISNWIGTSTPGKVKRVEDGFWGTSYTLFSYNSEGLLWKIENSNENDLNSITTSYTFNWSNDSLILATNSTTYKFARDSAGYVISNVSDSTWQWTYDSDHNVTSIIDLNYKKGSSTEKELVSYFYTWQNGEITTFNGIAVTFDEHLENRDYGLKYFPAFFKILQDPSSYFLLSKHINTGSEKAYFDDQNRLEKCNQGDIFHRFYYY